MGSQSGLHTHTRTHTQSTKWRGGAKPCQFPELVNVGAPSDKDRHKLQEKWRCYLQHDHFQRLLKFTANVKCLFPETHSVARDRYANIPVTDSGGGPQQARGPQPAGKLQTPPPRIVHSYFFFNTYYLEKLKSVPRGDIGSAPVFTIPINWKMGSGEFEKPVPLCAPSLFTLKAELQIIWSLGRDNP